jgi:hypothetical protein
MKFAHVPTYSVKELEQRAREVLCKTLGENYEIPIEVDLIPEGIEKTYLDYWPGLSGKLASTLTRQSPTQIQLAIE